MPKLAATLRGLLAAARASGAEDLRAHETKK
jgi:hypothetical protein